MQLVPISTAAVQTPFQTKMWEANRQLGLGLEAVSEDPMGVDLTLETVGTAKELLADGLELSAPAGAKAQAQTAIQLLTTAQGTLAASDDDGYPTQLDQGVLQVRAAMQLIGNASVAANATGQPGPL